MEELQKIIEGFKKAEKVCRELSERQSQFPSRRYFSGEADAYDEVVGVLEDFMKRYSVFAVKVWETQEKWDKGVQRLAEDLEKERSN